MHIRLMNAADLPAAMALKQAAGWNQTEQDWRLLVELQPDGCFVVESEGRVVASATAYCYAQDLAWIGMVLALPEVRGRGFGWRAFCAAVDFCRQQGIHCLKLDATAIGQPLYEHAGFLPEYQVERWGGLPKLVPGAALPGCLAVLDESRLQMLEARDTAAFGVTRDALLPALRRNADWSACLERDGSPLAYAMSRPGVNAHYFGPCLAETADEARVLLEAFFAGHPNQCVFADVPAPNAPARCLLQSYGLELRRTLLRMYRGRNETPGQPSRIFGLAGFEYG